MVGTLFGLFVTHPRPRPPSSRATRSNCCHRVICRLGTLRRVLTTCRHRAIHALAHVDAAVAAADRDVIVLTVRLIGQDVSDDAAGAGEPMRTNALFRGSMRLPNVTATGAAADRACARRVRPSPPARRLHSSEVYVGESATLSADDQASAGRGLGGPHCARRPAVRLLIQHRSGRMDSCRRPSAGVDAR
jgi:hypothetical protein